MTHVLAGLITAWLSFSAPAYAKQDPGCSALLDNVRAAFDTCSLCPTYVKPLVLFQASDDRAYLAMIGEMLEKQVGRSVSATTIYSTDQLRDKRVLEKFRTNKFVVVETLERFVQGPHGEINSEAVELLRSTLLKRMADQHPTLILVENPRSVNRYLRNLDSAPSPRKRAQ